MKRREFITLLGGAATWPLVAHAQQPVMPVIGYLGPGSMETDAARIAPFRKGLNETGFIESENVTIEFRWAQGRYERFQELAADLVRRQVAVIAAPGSPAAALAAKAATSVIPIVFGLGDDPVKLGMVASLNRPGGNATGINFLSAELVAKRLGLLRELLPRATRVAVLVNQADAERAGSVTRDAEAAAGGMGLQLHVLNASTSREIDAAFVALAREQPDALFVGPDVFFNNRRVQLANLAARYAIPASYAVRDYAEAGGLMSYGTDVADMYRQVGIYTGRILKGAKPAELPVMQSVKFELVINLQTARMLDLDVPPTLLARADR
jgi:putative tryptophan/tyrosine transport system substrate-binding protein